MKDDVRAELAKCIREHQTERGLSQNRMARLTGIPQPKLSPLLRGNTAGFSVMRLCRILVSLGYDVTFKIRPRPIHAGRGRITIG